MAEAAVSTILKKLALLVRDEVRLVVGVDEEVEKLTSNFTAIQSLLRDAERKQFKDESLSLRDWLDKLKDVSYDIEDVLDEWNTAIQTRKIMEAEIDSNLLTKVCSLIMSCFCLCNFRPAFMRHDIANKIKRLAKTLDVIASERNSFHLSPIGGTGEVESSGTGRIITTSSIDESEIQGRDDVKGNIKSLLLSESSNGPTSLTVISIVGMGGIGKTTLARLVFKDHEVTAHFDMKIWVCASDPFNEVKIGKEILKSLITKKTSDKSGFKQVLNSIQESTTFEQVLNSIQESTTLEQVLNSIQLLNSILESTTFEQVLNSIQKSIKDKKFLLVLDDVWTQDPNKWEQLKNTLKHGSKESRVLVTTRNMNVAEVLESTHKIQLEILSDQVSWSLFRQFAFSGRTDEECHKFEEVGRRIVEKCDGLPLAIKTLGGLLRFKKKIEQWQGVLDSEMWELKVAVKGILAPLLLSYIDLPYELKRCFSYCAIFPKDYMIDKDDLIKLWMAQDYLKVEGKKDMELVGEEYFEELAMRSFFQDFDRNQDDGSITCKMHDMVHDLAQYLTKNECLSVEVDGSGGFQLNACYKNAHHSMIVLKREASFPISIFDENRLRSLLFHCDGWGSEHMYIDTSKLFDHMSCIRALKFCYMSIKDVPIGVNKLIHLRYLDISGNKDIKELPEVICELYNLQTLIINGCRNLKKLPEGIEKLVNLRHLISSGFFDFFDLEYVSKGIERLTCLRTLDKVVVSGDKKACKFECLRNLNDLRGELWMKCSGVDVGEINKAEFKNKTKLLSLTIHLLYGGNTNEEALEDFQPPPNLEQLELRGYSGASRLSLNWMMSLTKLRKLVLRSWSHIGFERLSLGKLLCLESLEIWWMKSVKSMGDEFVGMESDNISSFSSSSLVIAFPKLQSLEFQYMEDWEEWDCGASGRGEEQIKIMPCLRSLTIQECPKLKTLPDYILQSTTLEELDIVFAGPILEKRYKVEKAENWVKGSGLPKIKIYENPMFSDDLESSSPSIVSFHDDVEDELLETQTKIADVSDS